jgi:hypothetical protein
VWAKHRPSALNLALNMIPIRLEGFKKYAFGDFLPRAFYSISDVAKFLGDRSEKPYWPSAREITI